MKRARKPYQAKEPDCIHSNHTQPASSCITCSQGPELAKWGAEWAAWLAENPDSPEARWVAEADKSGRYEPVAKP